MSALPLAGVGVLVTRPRARAAALARRIEAAGGKAHVYPAIEILPPSDPARFEAILAALKDLHWAIFVSPTAVERAFAALPAAAWPPTLRFAAVGEGSAQALARHGIADILRPAAGADSEALLALPALADMAGRRVAIFRGEGGRELLGATLAARGATVSYAEGYRRAPPGGDPAPLLALWHAGGIGAVTVTSIEALDNLARWLGEEGRARLLSTPLFALHERIAERARALGVASVVSAAPDDAALTDALTYWFAAHRD